MKRLTPLLLLLVLAPWASAQALTDQDLQGKQYMHSGTFPTTAGGGWARNDIEFEGAYEVKGIGYPEMYRLLRAGPNGEALRGVLTTDDNTFREVRRQSAIEAFSVGYPIDEIPWDADRHAIREGSPYIWLTIESGNFEIDERRNRRILTLGTDLMDDVYFDTRDWLMNTQRFTIRSRRRWDSPTELRRLLIGFKAEAGVDPLTRIKASAKVDIRTDSADADDILKLDSFVQSGMVGWSSSSEPAAPCRELYDRLRAKDVLPDTQSLQDVLLLEPKVFLRSIRSRYHLNECRLEAVRAMHDLGKTRLDAMVAMAQAAKAAGAIPANQVAAVDAWIAKVGRVLDRSLVAERAAAKLRQLDPAFQATAANIAALMPTAAAIAAPTTVEEVAARVPELEKRRIVAEAVSELYHELSKDLDDGSSNSVRRSIAQANDRALEAHADWFTQWRKAKDAKANGPKTTPDPFVAQLRELLARPAAARDADIAEYNKFGNDQKAAGRRPFRDFASVDAAALQKALPQLVSEQAKVWLRQLESAGTAARGLWFDQARELYVPDSDRAWGNFMIDTMDFTTSWPASIWDGVPVAERTAAKNPDESKLLHSVLVNELQIELTAVGEFTSRIRRLGGGYELARGLMRWGTQTNHPALAGGSDAAAYKKLHAAISALGEVEQKAELAKLATSMGTAPVSGEDFEALETNLLTPAVRDGQKPPALDVALTGARFVLDEYNRMMAVGAQVKGEGILEELRDRGAPAGISWGPISASKGETALTLQRQREPGPTPTTPTTPTTGLTGGLTGNTGADVATNTTRQTATVVTRGQTIDTTKIGAGRSHWYAIQLPAGQRVTFRLRFDNAAGNLDLALHRSTGARISGSAGNSNVELVTYRPQGGTTVYLRVFGRAATTAGEYKLEVR